MTPLSSLPDGSKEIVLDTSAVINIGRCGMGAEILQVIPNRFLVPDSVEFELRIGAAAGKPDHERLKGFIAAGLVEMCELGPAAESVFEQLTLGPGVQTIDDGEAATIALAVERRCYGIVDERKGNRVAANLYPSLERGTSADIFGHSEVFAMLGPARAADGLFAALRDANMSILDHQLAWAVRLIGKERAAQCKSIAKGRLEAVIKSEGL